MSFAFRPVQERDIPRICSFAGNPEELFFFFPAATWPLTHEQLRASIAQRSDSTVIERDDQVLGFANFYHWETQGTCTIGNLIVDPEARGAGVAGQLIGEMLRIARDKHQAAQVTLSCFNDNVAGLLLYPKLGFVPFAIEERRNKQNERVALIHLRHQPA
ncbi:GNAT family N-acetyltransferase [Pseudomonas chlororaphis subsp. aurantiaca]|uniref:GNAT family N-acetyltransferase n=1 Tax=Pseudomonas chlororaphis TaxID=587753 RepID=UPI0027DD265D|nr:GNAT family N-acetyltransferase [Pseudomonas chlororaphis]WMI99041.1 GNAT family N-acetyltransferase [Pseudomonas chlororaphis subsp. aurantiaca]